MRKLTKTLLFTAVFVMLMLTLALSASALNSNRVVDNEYILSASEESTLKTRLDEISTNYQCEIVFVTTRTFSGKTAERYTENYYDSNNYGYGSDNSGIILVVSKTRGEYYILLTGKGNQAFSDRQFNKLKGKVEDLFGDDDFYGGACAFADTCESVLNSYDNGGASFDMDIFVTGIIISLVVALIAALITVLVMRSKMNNAKPQKNATRYVKENSFQLTLSRDSYLYSTVKKIPRPQNNSSSRSGGRSGGGRRGGGGRF